jgi:putative tricarboxylic transport membrane protein
MSPRSAAFLAALLLSPAARPDAVAQGDAEPAGFKPQRPVRLVVYTGPGGMIDFTARKFAEVARKYSPEQPFVVINKPGAGGVVAFEEVIRQPADGHQILAVTRSNITKLVSAGRDDLFEGIEWAAYVMDNAHVVVANEKSGLDSWEAILEDSRARGGRQLWLGADIGGVKHVSAIRVWEKTGIRARWIPYSSGGQATAALLGQIGQVYFGNPSDASGNPALKIVAVCASERLAAFPEAPTFAELGIEGLEKELIWRGFAFPKATSPEVLAWFDDLARKVDADPDWRGQWEREGLHVVHKPAEEFRRIVEIDRELFRETLAPLGLLKTEDQEKWLGLVAPETAMRAGLALVGLLLLALWFGLVRVRSRAHRPLGEIAMDFAALFFAVAVLVLSGLLPPPNAVDQVGAAGVPRLWGAALLVLAATHAAILLRRRDAKDPDRPDEGLFRFLGLFLAYLFAMPLIGYHLATLLALPAASWLLGFRRPVPLAAITACWLAFAYFVFEKTLYVDLPGGRLVQLLGG